jgi:hypothetical protein
MDAAGNFYGTAISGVLAIAESCSRLPPAALGPISRVSALGAAIVAPTAKNQAEDWSWMRTSLRAAFLLKIPQSGT